MRLLAEMIYSSMPSNQELKQIREVGQTLTSDCKSVSVQVSEKDDRYAVALEFTMPTQAQYKVVDRVSNEVRRWLIEAYDGICISFEK
jgi:hypothetical protein